MLSKVYGFCVRPCRPSSPIPYYHPTSTHHLRRLTVGQHDWSDQKHCRSSDRDALKTPKIQWPSQEKNCIVPRLLPGQDTSKLNACIVAFSTRELNDLFQSRLLR